MSITPAAASATSYVDVAVFAAVGAGFVALSMLLNKLLASANPYGNKLETYECGEDSFQDARINFNIRYYIFALTFFVFDVEAVFIYPWAVVFKELSQVGLGMFVLVEMTLFLVVLGVGLLYAWKKKVLRWV